MKMILVLVGGAETDDAVLSSALAIATPFAAHLEFLHIRISASEAALYTPHVAYAMGAGLHDALDRLETTGERRSTIARRDVARFCEAHAIPMADAPTAGEGVSASWHEECHDAVERIVYHSRRADMVVLGRATRANGLPGDLIERLLLESGRPLFLAPPRVATGGLSTALVCWKETAASARALGVATPLLARCRRVVVAGVDEADQGSLAGVQDAAAMLRWWGIAAEPKWLARDGRSTPECLDAFADECNADLVVMGGYGRGVAQEMIFGGCTRYVIEHAARPVLLMH